MKKIIIKDNLTERLDVWLTNELNLSRSQVQKIIKQGEVLVNDKIPSAHYQLKAQDVIKFQTAKSPQVKAKNKQTDQDKFIVEVIKETPDYLVINKPAGLLMHGDDHETRYSLVDWLIKHYPKIKKIGEDPARPGIVHRLDKDVSGLVVIAKTQTSFDDLKRQFQKRLVSKCYEALVFGENLPTEGEINFRLARSTKGYRMAAKPANQAGKIAITEFSVLEKFYNYTLLKLRIKTGRTHQIRAHLAAYNHPVVGDDLYGSVKNKLANKKFNLNRVFLVAINLSFTDLAGNQQNFNIELPKELENFLKNLKVRK